MIRTNSDHDWEAFGKQDPYFGVISMDRFHKDAMQQKDFDDFFTSGANHIDFVLNTIHQHLDPNFAPSSALDFGCGVGRCTFPLARRCDTVTGVDVSESMLKEAELNRQKLDVDNVKWVESDDSLSLLKESYDLIHSFIVFQHIPQKRGNIILKRLIDALNIDGIGVFQFLYHRDVSTTKKIMGGCRKYVPFLHNVTNLIYGHPFNYPLMQKNAYNLNRILNIIQKSGCGNCYIQFEGTSVFQSAVIYFQKKKDAVPYDQFYVDEKN